MDKYQDKKVIDFEAARRKQRLQKWGGKFKSFFAKQTAPRKQPLAKKQASGALQWLQFFFFLAFAAYILQRCRLV